MVFTKQQLCAIKAMAHSLGMTTDYITDWLSARRLTPSVFGAAIADRMQYNEISAAMIGTPGNRLT